MRCRRELRRVRGTASPLYPSPQNRTCHFHGIRLKQLTCITGSGARRVNLLMAVQVSERQVLDRVLSPRTPGRDVMTVERFVVEERVATELTAVPLSSGHRLQA